MITVVITDRLLEYQIEIFLDETLLRKYKVTRPSSPLNMSTGSMFPFWSLSVLGDCAGVHTAFRSKAASFSRIASHVMRSPPWHPPAPAPRCRYTAERAPSKTNSTKFKVNPRCKSSQQSWTNQCQTVKHFTKYHCSKRWHNQRVPLINEHKLTLQKLTSQRPLQHKARGILRLWTKLYWKQSQTVTSVTIMTNNDIEWF